MASCRCNHCARRTKMMSASDGHALAINCTAKIQNFSPFSKFFGKNLLFFCMVYLWYMLWYMSEKHIPWLKAFVHRGFSPSMVYGYMFFRISLETAYGLPTPRLHIHAHSAYKSALTPLLPFGAAKSPFWRRQVGHLRAPSHRLEAANS